MIPVSPARQVIVRRWRKRSRARTLPLRREAREIVPEVDRAGSRGWAPLERRSRRLGVRADLCV
jgi:hypothetical protein